MKRYADKIALKTSNQVILSTWWHDQEGRYIEYCHVKGEFLRQTMINCLGSSTSRNRPVGFLLGDSHARNYLIAARNAFPRHTIKYLTMGYGCAFMPSSMISDSIDSKVKCAKYVEEASKYVQKLARPGDIVFIGQALRDGHSAARSTPEYFSHIEAFASKLMELRVPVVLFDGAYPPGKHPELCTKEFWRPFPGIANCEKPIRYNKTAYQRFDHMASELARRTQNIFYAPIRIGLCANAACGQYTSLGTQIWHDNGHITEKASGELAGLLKRELRAGGFFDYLGSAQKHKSN